MMIAFSIGTFHIYRYGIMYFISFIIWYFLLWYGVKSWRYKNNVSWVILKEDLDWLLLSLLIWVVVGWRLWHIFIYDFHYFFYQPWKFFAFQEWGMSFIGGILWVVTSVLLYVYYFSPIKKYDNKKEFFLSLFDIIVPIIPIGIFFWRLWNFLNQELYGRVVSDVWNLSDTFTKILTQLWFFHVYPWIDESLRVNTNLFSMLFEWVLLMIILCYFSINKTKSGLWKSWQLSMVFLWMYSLIRFLLEYLRQDSQEEFMWFFTISQRFFIVFFVIAIIGFYKLRQKK